MILTLNVSGSVVERRSRYQVHGAGRFAGEAGECSKYRSRGNRLVKKGELLFRIDPTPYQNDVNVARAKLAADEASSRRPVPGW